MKFDYSLNKCDKIAPGKYLGAIFFILVLSASLLLASNITDKAEKEIRSVFKSDVTLEFSKYRIPKSIKKKIEYNCRQRFFRNEVYLWKIYKNNEFAGIALLDNVIGKVKPITFVVVFDKSGKIKHAKVIKYREEHGRGVMQDWWLEQFEEKDNVKNLNVGNEIDGISGATLSVNSMTKGIKKLILLSETILNDYRN